MHLLTETAAFSQQLAPQQVTGSGAFVESGGARVSMAAFEHVVFLVEVGAIAAATNLDVKVIQANAASSGTTKDVTGAALVTVTDAAGQNKLYAIEVKADQLDQANGFAWLNVSYQATNTKTVQMSVVGVRHHPRNAFTSGLTQAIQQVA
jgi:hypothetical protein